MSKPRELRDRTNYLRAYVPKPMRRAYQCERIDTYSPTQATAILCHALRVTLDTLDSTLTDVDPNGMRTLCGEITDALRIMNAIELYGLRGDEPIWVSDTDAWMDWQRLPQKPANYDDMFLWGWC